MDFSLGKVSNHFRSFELTLPSEYKEELYDVYHSKHTIVSTFLKDLITNVPECRYMRSQITSIALRESCASADGSYKFDALIGLSGSEDVNDDTLGRLIIKIKFK